MRAWRERATPAQAGIVPGGDRRVPGLRREELALLAGISVDYLVRLEQGRAANPSVQVLGAFARALQLSAGERDMLYRLGGAVPPPRGAMPRVVPRGVQLMIDRMSDTPLAVYTAAWDIVQWNHLWADLMGDLALLDERDRNLVWRHFAGQSPTRVVRDAAHTEDFEREMVADLRRAAERYPDDRTVTDLIDALRQVSPSFVERWSRYETAPPSPSRKTVLHPELGLTTYDCDVLILDGSDLRIVLYSAVPAEQ